MKKFVKFILILLIIGLLSIGLAYAFTPKDGDEKPTITDILKKPLDFLQQLFSASNFIDPTKLKSDDLFNQDSKVKLSINETNFNSYFTDKTLTSNKELVKLYQDAYRSLKIFETNSVKPELNLYINLENDLGKSMYIYVTVIFAEEKVLDYDPDFVPEAKIKEIELKWYNQDLIASYLDGKTSYGKVSQNLLGTSFKITNKSKASVKLMQKEAEGYKDYDLEYIYHMDNKKVDDIVTVDAEGKYTGITVAQYSSSEIQRICDSLYTDLFQVDVAKDETIAPIGKVKKISLDGLKRIADCKYTYDKEVYGNHPLNDIWDAHYKEFVDKYDEDPMDMLLFAVDFFNEKTLDKKTFYLNVWADALRDDQGNLIGDSNGMAEVYEYYNNTYHLVGIYNGRYSWVSSKEYDLTDYREWSLEQTFMFSNYQLMLNTESYNFSAATVTFQNLMNINETDFPSEIMQNIFITIEKEI